MMCRENIPADAAEQWRRKRLKEHATKHRCSRSLVLLKSTNGHPSVRPRAELRPVDENEEERAKAAAIDHS